jgi:hypothetical protein
VVFGAKEVKSVKRVSVYVDPSTGEVTVYVADEAGNSNESMVDAVETVMPDWAPLDSLLNVVGGAIYEQAIDISFTVRTGANVEALKAKIRQALISRLQLLQPGETLERSAISTAAENVDKAAITRVIVNVPAASIAPGADESIRTTGPLISFT